MFNWQVMSQLHICRLPLCINMQICHHESIAMLMQNPTEIQHLWTTRALSSIALCWQESHLQMFCLFRVSSFPTGSIELCVAKNRSLGKPSIKKKGNFVNKIHKTLTPPPSHFYERLFFIFFCSFFDVKKTTFPGFLKVFIGSVNTLKAPPEPWKGN